MVVRSRERPEESETRGSCAASELVIAGKKEGGERDSAQIGRRQSALRRTEVFVGMAGYGPRKGKKIENNYLMEKSYMSGLSALDFLPVVPDRNGDVLSSLRCKAAHGEKGCSRSGGELRMATSW